MFTNNKKLLFLIISVFITINFIFNFSLWKELFGKNAMVSDNVITEYLVETSYQNVLHLKNPYITKTVLYPFETNFSMNDSTSAFVLPFIFLRPFLNPHKSFLLITLIGFFLNNILMYLLLRKFKVNKILSVIFSLVFGFMPFLSHRILGHYTYIPVYFFPLIFILILELIKNKNPRNKIFISIGLGLSLTFTILTNFYYFFEILFGILFYSSFNFFSKNKKEFLKIIWTNAKYFLLAFLTFLTTLIPWIIQVFQFMYFDGFVKQEGFVGAPALSADFFSFFIPSEYNPIYKSIFLHIEKITPIFTKITKFFFSSWERFAYPGIIILFIYISTIFFKKKLSKLLLNKIQPHFFISLLFALLSMGPFFKIFNHWALPLGDGISFVLPLPYILLHYLPILNSLRAPMRFNPGFVFLAVLVSSMVMNYFIGKINSKKIRITLYLTIFFIFIFDQIYIIPPRIQQQVPNKLYQIIKNDKEKSTVLEIPFTVRDGFRYLGFVHAISIMGGPLNFDKPVIGGYLARINPGVFDYYSNLPFISYVLQITDKGNYDPYKEKPKRPTVFSFQGNLDLVNKELDFLDVKYILLKDNEEYSNSIKKTIETVGYYKKISDSNYDLYVRKLSNDNYEKISFGEMNDYLFTATGFSFKEDGYRWAQGKLSKVFIKTNDINKKKLVFESLSFYKPQKVKVYVNKKFVGEKDISIEKNKYTLDINESLESGINTVYFVFSKSFSPAKLWTYDKDMRDLSMKLFSIKLE